MVKLYAKPQNTKKLHTYTTSVVFLYCYFGFYFSRSQQTHTCTDTEWEKEKPIFPSFLEPVDMWLLTLFPCIHSRCSIIVLFSLVPDHNIMHFCFGSSQCFFILLFISCMHSLDCLLSLSRSMCFFFSSFCVCYCFARLISFFIFCFVPKEQLTMRREKTAEI